jgi:plastocyanin
MTRLLASLFLPLAVLVACAGGSANPTTRPSVAPDALSIEANGLAFSTTSLTAPADKPFQVVFDNQEAALHNVAIYRDATAAEKVFGEDPISGPAVVVYEVPALGAGTYFFRCDVHPDMSGSLTVG